MFESNVRLQPTAGTRAISILSLCVAALALTISVATFFNGSARQDRFETTRQYCLEKLVDLGRTLSSIQFEADTGSSAQLVEEARSSVIAKIACFDSGLLDEESEAFDQWWVTRTILQFAIVDAGATTDVGVAATDRLDVVDDLIGAALAAPSPSIFPWVELTPAPVVSTD